MKPKFSVSTAQLCALSQALDKWVALTREVREGDARRVRPVDVLAFQLLHRLLGRVQRQVVSTAGPPRRRRNGRPVPLSLSLSLPEMLGLYYCVPWGSEDVGELTYFMGQVQQQLLCFDRYVALP